jgi:mannobiose 2-epimerase
MKTAGLTKFVLLTLAAFFSLQCRTSTGNPGMTTLMSHDAAGLYSEDRTDFNQLTATETALLQSIRSKTVNLHQAMAKFWLTRGPDKTNGGFYGYHDINGNPDLHADKGLINQSRHLWYVSNYYKNVAKTPEVRAAADSLFKFITTSRLYDNQSGEFFFRVNNTGTHVTEERKQFYANSFAIYGLANYGAVFNSSAAKAHALKAYESMARRGWDSVHGGFNQKNDPWYFSDGNAEKDYNSQLHIMEAITSLYLATNNADAKAKLLAYIDVFADKMIGGRSYIHSEYRLDFTPYGEAFASFGHDLETVWLLLEAADALDLKHTDPNRYQNLISKLQVIGEYSAEHGFDAKNGGYYESGRLDGTIKSSLKVWWVQAEAVSGLWQLYRLTGKVKYLHRIENTLNFIEKFLVTPSGEWYWQVEADGSPNSAYNFMSGEWKASYHNGRTLINMNRWITDLLQDGK